MRFISRRAVCGDTAIKVKAKWGNQGGDCQTIQIATQLSNNDRRAVNQGEFNFDTEQPNDGYAKWLTGRRLAAVELARRINLPLGHQVEVWLYGGVRWRGELRLREEMLFLSEEHLRHLELKVDHVPFTYREMESCVRLD